MKAYGQNAIRRVVIKYMKEAVTPTKSMKCIRVRGFCR
jgi:hypothetical protein